MKKHIKQSKLDAAGIAVGIVVTVIGIAAGVISIISGARLLKEKKGILF